MFIERNGKLVIICHFTGRWSMQYDGNHVEIVDSGRVEHMAETNHQWVYGKPGVMVIETDDNNYATVVKISFPLEPNRKGITMRIFE